MSRYACPRHGLDLVSRWLVVTVRRKQRKYEYFACPVKDCDFKKPNKWKGHREIPNS